MVQNETQTYSLRFGEKSESDKQNLKIFEEYGAKQAGEKFKGKDPRSFFEIIQDFNKIVENYDMKFTWEKVDLLKAGVQCITY